MKRPSQENERNNVVTLDDLAAERLPAKLLKAVEEVEVQRAVDVRLVLEDGNLVVAGTATVALVKVRKYFVWLVGILGGLFYILFPVLRPLLDRIMSGN